MLIIWSEACSQVLSVHFTTFGGKSSRDRRWNDGLHKRPMMIKHISYRVYEIEIRDQKLFSQVFFPPHDPCSLTDLSFSIFQHILSPVKSTGNPFFKARHRTNTDNFRITLPLHQLQHVTPMMCCSLRVTALSPGRHKPHSQSKREAVMHHSCILSGRTTPTQDAFDPSTNKSPHMRQTFDTASNSNSHREAYRK